METKEEIRIAFTHPRYPHSGAERVTQHIINYLASTGSYQIFMFVGEVQQEFLAPSDRENITFVPLAFWDKDVYTTLSAEIERLGIDILVTMPWWLRKFGEIERRSGCKVVYAHHNQSLWEDIAYMERKSHLARVSGNPFKWLFWHLVKCPFESLSGRYKRGIIRKYRYDYLSSDLYTMLCEGYKEHMIEIMGPELATPDDNHIEAIPNYIPPKDYDSGAKKKQVLYIGRLTYDDKRVDRLLDIWGMVWRDHPEWELVIVGRGPERERLMRQSARLGLERVEFRGHTADPSPYYRDASILCLTSNFEGWPMVIAEGQQAGVVPVAFDVCAGIRDQITPDGMNGFLVPPFDKKEFARRLSGLMADDELRGRMSRNVVVKARKYSHESRLDLWDDAFRRLVSTVTRKKQTPAA